MSRQATNDLRGSTRQHVASWLPALLWASVIFFFSTDLFSSDNTSFIIGSLLRALVPGLSTQDVEFFHAVVRKLGHFSEYFIFTVLLVRALRNDNGGEIKSRHLLISIAIATLYAISDEFHQSFVRSRSASAVDVLIDMCGGVAGIFWSHLRNRDKHSAPPANCVPYMVPSQAEKNLDKLGTNRDDK
jgi:VanZ family protein